MQHDPKRPKHSPKTNVTIDDVLNGTVDLHKVTGGSKGNGPDLIDVHSFVPPLSEDDLDRFSRTNNNDGIIPIDPDDQLPCGIDDVRNALNDVFAHDGDNDPSGYGAYARLIAATMQRNVYLVTPRGLDSCTHLSEDEVDAIAQGIDAGERIKRDKPRCLQCESDDVMQTNSLGIMMLTALTRDLHVFAMECRECRAISVICFPCDCDRDGHDHDHSDNNEAE